jgi:hypothetical protein
MSHQKNVTVRLDVQSNGRVALNLGVLEGGGKNASGSAAALKSGQLPDGVDGMECEADSSPVSSAVSSSSSDEDTSESEIEEMDMDQV